MFPTRLWRVLLIYIAAYSPSGVPTDGFLAYLQRPPSYFGTLLWASLPECDHGRNGLGQDSMWNSSFEITHAVLRVQGNSICVRWNLTAVRGIEWQSCRIVSGLFYSNLFFSDVHFKVITAPISNKSCPPLNILFSIASGTKFWNSEECSATMSMHVTRTAWWTVPVLVKRRLKPRFLY